MTLPLRRQDISQWEGWGIVLGLYVSEFLVSLFLYLSEEKISLILSIDVLHFFGKILIYGGILVFCMKRFGGIDAAELIPDRRGSVILLVAIFIEFWIFGMLVGPEGLKTNAHESIQALPPSLVWVGVFVTVGVVPLVEEGVFRRYFLEIQRQHYSTTVAIVITSGVATLFHFTGSWLSLLWHFPQQVFLSFVYVRSRLGVSVLVHAFVNGLILLLSR